jgi:hypothetical protein
VSSRRCARWGSTSTTSPTPSFIVIASGWAPPISPSPAVRTNLPLSEAPGPKWVSAAAASVS